MQLISKQQAIQELSELKELCQASKVFLFGSVARGEQHEHSDIDAIFVIDTGIAFHRRSGLVLDSYNGNLPIEPIIYTPQEFSKMQKSPVMQEMLKGAVQI